MKKHLIVSVLTLSAFSIQAEGVNLINEEGVDPTCLPYQSVCVNCPEYKTIFPLEEFSHDPDSLEIEAGQSEVLANQIYHFSDDVTLKSDSHFLAADDIEVSTIDDATLAKGNVKFQDETYLIISDELTAKKENNKLIATATNAYYQDISLDTGGANGFAEFISKTPESILLNNATFSLCPFNHNDWLVEASFIELNLEKNRGRANHALIEFYGVPILYFPKYSWVLEGRGSGFLTPSYATFNDSSTKKGSYHLRIPYYFNLAPDRDLLLATTYIKYRGFMYEGKYRQLFGRKVNDEGENEDSILQIDARYISNDWTSEIDRWFLDASLELDLNDKTHLSSTYHRVSDEKYYKEINHYDTTELSSNFKLSYYDDKNYLGGHILRKHTQILDGCSLACRQNYLKAYEVSLTKSFQWEKKRQTITTELVSTKFTNKTPSKVSGTRTHGNIGFKRTHLVADADNIYLEIPILTTRANISSTYYNLDNSNSITRNLGGVGIDLAFPIKNKGTMFGENTSHLLVPKFSYNYRGRKAQGDIPNFDTTDNFDDIITFSELTSNERYIGLDRISNANDFTYSIESGFRDIDSKKSASDLLNIKLAQTYHVDDTVVSDAPNTDYEVRRHYSNIAASVGVALGNFSFNSSFSIEPEKLAIVGRSNAVSYNVNPRKFVSVSYSNDIGTGKRTVKLYGSLPITKSIHVFGGRDKTTSTNTTHTEISGIAYESCCWAFRVAHIKKAAATDYDYSTVAELILTGLGSTASSLNERIEDNIPGYVSSFD